MTERPILFSGPMVRGVLADTKTQTRRVGKIQSPDFVGLKAESVRHETLGFQIQATREAYPGRGTARHGICACPYGKPGDRLWVRETFYAWGRWETRYSARKGRDEWHFIDMTQESGKAYLYAADGPRPQPLAGKRDGGTTPKWWKRPAIHMPRTASRITLEITSVRVERLQAISESDCWAEGIEEVMHDFDEASQCDMAKRLGCCIKDAKPLYAQLWESINGPGSWEANPWVWVVEFRRLP